MADRRDDDLDFAPSRAANRSSSAAHAPGKRNATAALSPSAASIARAAVQLLQGHGVATSQAPPSAPAAPDRVVQHTGNRRALDDPFGIHLLDGVQLRGEPGAERSGAAIHAAAQAGTRGGGGALPFLETIQASFGTHDVTGISAHVGGAAADACDGMGAAAYASGNHVAFKSSPDLHTAAHEAAHVIQQRGGVQLLGGVGVAGDSYERHADAVADRVVQGVSAVDLLDSFAGGTASRAVQRQQPTSRTTPGGLPPEVASLNVGACQQLAEDIYVGKGAYAQRGILDHKLTGLSDMRTLLSEKAPTPIAEQILGSVVLVGVAAGAAALAANPFGGSALAAGILAGGAATIQELPKLFSRPDNAIDHVEFCSKYESGVRIGWPSSVATLKDQMIRYQPTAEGPDGYEGSAPDEDYARRQAAAVKAMADNPELVKRIQRQEILDEYSNAVNKQSLARVRDTGFFSMGGAPDPRLGRMELNGGSLSVDDTTIAWNDPDTVQLPGIPTEKLRNMDLDRKIGDIKTKRIMKLDVSGTYGSGRSIEVSADDTVTCSDSTVLALASFAVGRKLDEDTERGLIRQETPNGVRKAWEMVKDKTPKQLNKGKNIGG